MIKPWVRDIIEECRTNGHITSEGVRHIAARYGRYYTNGANLLSELRRIKTLRVEVVGKIPSKLSWVHASKQYRVTERAAAVNAAQRVPARAACAVNE